MAGKKRPKRKKSPFRTTREQDGAPAQPPANPTDPVVRDELAPPAGRTRRLDSPDQVVRVLAQVATSLWYLKTKHFKQDWTDPGADLDDARERRAVGRVEKAVEALASVGVEVEDPTNRRYAPGSEGLMKPIEFVPTAGIGQERVSETMRPIVFVKGHLVQRAEVFVAVPTEPPAAPPSEPAAESPSEPTESAT